MSNKFALRLFSYSRKNRKFTNVFSKFSGKVATDEEIYVEKDEKNNKHLFLQNEKLDGNYPSCDECCGNIENICDPCPYNKYD